MALGAAALLAGCIQADAYHLANEDRAACSAPPAELDLDLLAEAQRRADRLAETDDLQHTQDFRGIPARYDVVGENIGRASVESRTPWQGVEAIELAFLDSPTHRAIICDPRYRAAGVGVTVDEADDLVYVVQLFAR